jgi:acetyltransferase-like isoleucine patch superfamily enzyme
LNAAATNLQLRRHLPPAWLTRVRAVRARFRGVEVGRDVVLYPGVQLLRFPSHIRIGDTAIVKTGAHLCPCNESARISVGARTTVGFQTFVYASADISIGDDCMIAPFVYIVDSDHGIARGMPMNRQPNTSTPISIGNDVWIGAHAVILSGTVIEDGAIVAAGAVVRGHVGANTIVGGVPARKIGERT